MISEVLIPLVVYAVQEGIARAVEDGIKYVFRKVVDSFGRTTTQLVYLYDDDEDGETDREEVILTLDTTIPDLDNGYCLCNKGDELGLGYPAYSVIDGGELSSRLGDVELLGDDVPAVFGDGGSFLVDFDGDGELDDVLVPWIDVTGDNLPEFRWILDDDNNGIPDISPYSPFYPVGSEEYDTIIERETESGIMDKRIDHYTVTEGLLLLSLLISAFSLVRGFFRRSDYLR